MKTYLDFYKMCMKTGFMPTNGLCFSLRKYWDQPANEILFREDDNGCVEAYIPSKMRDELLDWFNPDGLLCGYWGFDHNAVIYPLLFQSSHDTKYEFTPLRQTIVLLLAAINDEL